MSSAVEIVRKFTQNKIWRKVYGLLATDWMSIREASIEVDQPKEKRGYTLNESVRRCVNELKETKFLKTKEVEKEKESTDRKEKTRVYIDQSIRHRLNLTNLWSSYFAEEYSLSKQEEDFLSELLEEGRVSDLLKCEELGSERVSELFSTQFSFVNRAGVREFFEFLERVARVGKTTEDVNDLLDLVPESDPRPSRREALEFFERLRGDDEVIDKLSKRLDQGPEKLKAELFDLAEDFLKSKSRYIAERNLSRKYRDSNVLSRFSSSFIESILGNPQIAIELSEKITQKA